MAPPDGRRGSGSPTPATSPLALITPHIDRQKLASGNELLAVTGRVINPTDSEQAVPPIHAQMRNQRRQVVYSWTIAPPAPTLAPGRKREVQQRGSGCPAGGDELTITLGRPRA